MLIEQAKERLRNKVHAFRYPRTIELLSPTGSKLSFRINNSVEQFRVERYGGERDFLNRFVASLQPDDVVFDIGASVGLMTVHAASVLPQGQVVAFEPDPETCGRLYVNTHLNELRNVEIATWAVSDQSGEIQLYTDGAEGFAPSLQKQPERCGAPSSSIRVWGRPLDDALAQEELPSPTVLKIDIEGAEILCLRGATGLLNGDFGPRPRLIFLEAHPEFLPAFGASVDEVRDLVTDLGYEVLWQVHRDEQIHYGFAPTS